MSSRHLSPDAGCERARALASLELDGELSQLERELLAAHGRGCEACAAFADKMWAVTHVVRETPLETLERQHPFQPPAVPRRGRRVALRLAAAATLAALAAGLGALTGSLSRGPAEPVRVPVGPVALLPSTPPNPSRAQDSRPRARPGSGESRPSRVGPRPDVSSRPASSYTADALPADAYLVTRLTA
jgi:hypothetical protein